MTREIQLCLLTFVASGIGTATGFGTSTVMVPVMVLHLALPEALLFVGVIHLFGDLWKLLLFRRGLDWKLALGFGVSGVAASFLGASLSLQGQNFPLERVLGAFLLLYVVLYVVYLLREPGWALPKTRNTAVCGGLLSGLLAGMFGVGGAVRGAFLTAFDLPKEVYLFTSGLIALFIDVTRIGRYLWGGTRLPPELQWVLALSIPASFAGAYLARRFLNRLPQRSFRGFVGFFLALVGAKLVFWP